MSWLEFGVIFKIQFSFVAVYLRGNINFPIDFPQLLAASPCCTGEALSVLMSDGIGGRLQDAPEEL